jgi:hypothetical protein
MAGRGHAPRHGAIYRVRLSVRRHYRVIALANCTGWPRWEGAQPAPSASAVEDVADRVEVVRVWVVAGTHDAELTIEGADARSELAVDLGE